MAEPIRRRVLFGSFGAEFALSPDGQHIAWLEQVDGVRNIWVGPLAVPLQGRPASHDRDPGIRNFKWLQDSRHIVYEKDKDGDENYHVFAIDYRSGDTRDLTPIAGVRATVSQISRCVPGRILLAMNDRDPRFEDAYLVDPATGQRELIWRNPGSSTPLFDDLFALKLVARLNGTHSIQYLKPHRDDVWEPWLELPLHGGRVPAGYEARTGGRALFCLHSRDRDTSALVRIDLATGEESVIAAADEADVDGVMTHPETHEPIAYSVTYERRRWFALDESVREDFAYLDQQDIGEWQVTSQTDDGGLWIVFAESDLKPRTTYLYDRSQRSLVTLGVEQPALQTIPLSPMQALTIRSRDGLNLVSYLTRPAAEATTSPGMLVVLVHGGPWVRDRFGFNQLHQWLADRGYCVLSVNFRSSIGFGKSFVEAGDGEWGRRMDDDLLDAVNWAISAGVADPGKVAIMGFSYGGYAVLASLARSPEMYRCGIAFAAPANLESLARNILPYYETDRARLIKAIGDPETASGRALLRERSPVQFAGRIRAPLLLGCGTNDVRVSKSDADHVVDTMKREGVPVTYLVFDGEGHNMSSGLNWDCFLGKAETFLERHLGGRAEPESLTSLFHSSMQVICEA